MRFNKKRLYASLTVTSLVLAITSSVFTIGGLKYIKAEEKEIKGLAKVFDNTATRFYAFGNTGFEDGFSTEDLAGKFDAFGEADSDTPSPISKPGKPSSSPSPNSHTNTAYDKEKPPTFNPDNPDLSLEFMNFSLSISKQKVMDKYQELHDAFNNSEGFSVTYNHDKNVIMVEIKGFDQDYPMVYVRGALMTDWDTEYTVINSSETNIVMGFTDEKGYLNYYVEPTAAYNGHMEIIADDYPIVIYYSPTIEPLAGFYVEEDSSAPPTTLPTEPDINDAEWEGYEDYEDLTDDKIDWESIEDRVDEERPVDYSDFWASDSEENDPNSQGTNTPDHNHSYNPNDIDFNKEVDNLLNDIIGKSKKDRSKYKPIWGVMEAGDRLKENVKDRAYIEDKILDKQTLNVVNLKGERVDLVEKTKNTRPATLERILVEDVGEGEYSKDFMPVVKASAGVSALLMMLTLTSIQLYYKESCKEIRMKVIEEDTTELEVRDVLPEGIEIEDIL